MTEVSARGQSIGSRLRRWLLVGVSFLVIVMVAYTWAVLSWSFSVGERAGWVQKLSRKGWVCKTWEGEMAMVTVPGTVPDKFAFTVREDAVADAINRLSGRRVSLSYEEKVGVPGSCFGDTAYFVTGVRAIDDAVPLTGPAQLMPPAAGAAGVAPAESAPPAAAK
jgi:hypothetical protein